MRFVAEIELTSDMPPAVPVAAPPKTAALPVLDQARSLVPFHQSVFVVLHVPVPSTGTPAVLVFQVRVAAQAGRPQKAIRQDKKNGEKQTRRTSVTHTPPHNRA